MNKANFYIPIFEADGSLAYSKEDFDAKKKPQLVEKMHAYQKKEEQSRLDAEQWHRDNVASKVASGAPVTRPML